MILRAASLDMPGIRHAFFTRAGGVSEGLYATLNAGVGSDDRPEHVAENRARMAAALGVPHLLTLYQVHSPDVVVAERPWDTAHRPRADALVTKVPGLAIGVSSADCGPVLMVDPEACVIGAAHAGWRGALTGVVEATVAAMERLGARRDRIRAALGPMIRQSNYEVGPEFVAHFTATDAENVRFFAPGDRPGHPLFDLPGFIRARLEQARIGAIEDTGRCTYAEADLFYSYRRSTHRREPDYGRHVHAIALVKA